MCSKTLWTTRSASTSITVPIAMSYRQLAMAGRFLAHLGRNPATGYAVVHPERARRINAVMLTCGCYDGTGELAYRVGLPGTEPMTRAPGTPLVVSAARSSNRCFAASEQ